jgi:hypothetical protein
MVGTKHIGLAFFQFRFSYDNDGNQTQTKHPIGPNFIEEMRGLMCFFTLQKQVEKRVQRKKSYQKK